MQRGSNLYRVTDLGRKSTRREVPSIQGIPWCSKPESDQAVLVVAAVSQVSKIRAVAAAIFMLWKLERKR